MKKILITLFSLIFLISSYFLLSDFNEAQINQKTYQEVKEIAIQKNESSNSHISQKESVTIEVDFEALMDINPDVFAWIQFEDTNINYPVVLGEDNDYYLNHTIYGEENIAGSIFMDYENQRHLPDYNNIIYGHYVYDGALKGSMFSDLHKYKEQSFYDSHPSFDFIIEDKSYKVEIFSAYVAHVSQPSWRIFFDDDQDFNQWLNEVKSLSSIETAITPVVTDKILTLSTCTFEIDDARYIIHGILKEIE